MALRFERPAGRWSRTNACVALGILLGAGILVLPVTSWAASPSAAPRLLFADPVAYPSGVHAHGIAAAQLAGDASVDLAVANAFDGTVSILQGSGGGRFAEVPDPILAVGTEPKSVVAVDLNGDDAMDLVTANQGSADVSVLLRTGDGYAPAVSAPACEGAHEVAAADLDGDGDPDLAVACWGSNQMAVLANDGAGTFTPTPLVTVGWTGHSVVPIDVDEDGDLDLAVAAHSTDLITISPNEGGLTFGPFTRVPVGTAPHSVRAGDLDADGHTDLVTANDGADSVSVLLGDGQGGFRRIDQPTGREPKSVAIADVDGDGILDLVTANADGNYPDKVDPSTTSLSVLLGAGDGTFGAPIRLASPGTPFAVIASDLDADGDLDLAAAGWHGGTATVLLQEP